MPTTMWYFMCFCSKNLGGLFVSRAQSETLCHPTGGDYTLTAHRLSKAVSKVVFGLASGSSLQS
jgi:hypothetical protein